jgi:hypothetical protein
MSLYTVMLDTASTSAISLTGRFQPSFGRGVEAL